MGRGQVRKGGKNDAQGLREGKGWWRMLPQRRLSLNGAFWRLKIKGGGLDSDDGIKMDGKA